jgi:hypothetical protein
MRRGRSGGAGAARPATVELSHEFLLASVAAGAPWFSLGKAEP